MNYKCNREQFIAKSKEKFGEDAFDYSKVEYINGYTEITLICKEHGEFRITPSKHLDIVGGCPKCSKTKRKKRKIMTNEEYKKLVIEKHGNEYDLSPVQYQGMRKYVTAICPKHGEFKINAYCFVHSGGCGKCGIEERGVLRTEKKSEFKNWEKLTTERFIEKAKAVHGDKYDYSKTDLEHRDEKKRVLIICPEHGEFWQSPFSHIKGCECSKCGRKKISKARMMTTEQFIEKAKAVHGDKYDYSTTVYNGCYEMVKIGCPIHGKFWQKACVHLTGHGCNECSNEGSSKLLSSNTKEFIEKAKKIHKYENFDYSFVDYKSAIIPVKIKCEKGHTFFQKPCKHLNGHGCPYCTKNVSSQEKEIKDYINSLGFDVRTSDRKILTDAKELDLIIPSKNIAIEFDGLYWHCEDKKPDKRFHLNKTIECNEKGIRLIHIFEDEWINHEDIVKSRLKAILGVETNKVFARKCEVREIDSKTCKGFLDNNHLQGKISSSVRYGLYYKDELVSVMTFCKPRKNLGQEGGEGEYELLRFCNKLNTVVVGGANKLFQHFVKEKNPNSVISYADRRWNTGQVYENMGFEFTHFSDPDYSYVIGTQRCNKYNFKKELLVKQGFDPNKSEHEIMLERGIYRIYDCGCLCYKWIKKGMNNNA